jgi:hypothetical protein
MDASKVNFPQVPSRTELSNGTYKCLSCNPPITVKADGTDQQVAGYPYDTLNVRIIDKNRVEMVQRRSGQIIEKYLFSANEKIQTVVTSTYAGGGEPVTSTVTDRRVGDPLPGMHLVSGSWLMEKPDSISEEASLIILEQTADGLRMNSPLGEHFVAKFDGREYPDEGSTQTDHVIVRQIDSRTIEETDKLRGQVVSTNRLTVSEDGRTMQVTVKLPNGRTQNLLFNKQQ